MYCSGVRRGQNWWAGARCAIWPPPTCAALAIALALAAPTFAADIGVQRKPLDADFAQKLETLAAKCDELGLHEQAATTRDWIIRRDAGRQTLFLPADSDTTRPASDAPELAIKWHVKFREHRNAQAAALFKLAQEAAIEGQTGGAYQLLHEVLREDPDHVVTRKVLGYLGPTGGVWRRAGATSAVRPSHAPIPLLAGKSWKAETANFSIATNHNAVVAQQLGAELEKLHDVWRQLFVRQWLSAGELKSRLKAGKPPALAKSKKQVTLFKGRDEYVASLGREVPGIELSKGIYVDGKQTVYLYGGDAQIRPTWYHEATHQLFHESGEVAPAVGIKENCWIIEGIALYMESLVLRDGYCTVGGFDADRLQDARYRAKIEGFQLPLTDLTKLGRDALQKHADVRKLYSQSAGLTHFLMDDKQGKYRAALSDYVATVYQGRDAADTLAKVTGTRLTDLDIEYRGSLGVTDDDLATLNPTPHVPSLRIARTAVTDKGLRHLAGHPELQSVDLSGLAISDAGLAFLADSVNLKELMLDGTGVTDASLVAIGKLQDLEYLDLANLPITDDGLAHLSGLKKLQTLYLSRTKVSDAGLAHLKGLKLETLDVEGTAVTAVAAKNLMK